jgi:putative ABC transport system ATP-binding protein
MLRLEGLVKYFGRGTVNEVLAINGIDLSVAPGEFVCIIGSNGAGKSTLLGCISGTSRQDSGRTVLDGKDISRWPEYKRAKLIGRVFQDPLSGTCASMTIEENMALALRRGRFRGLSKGITKEERDFYKEALSRLDLGLENRLTDAVGLLSGGQRQSLTLLMATLIKPTILLLDEHTAALDPKTAELTMELTLDLVEKNKLTTLMITHNMQQALTYGRRLIMMHRGRIILDFDDSEKRRLTVRDLLSRFRMVAPDGQDSLSDRLVLG